MPDENVVIKFPEIHSPHCHICGDTTDYKLQPACKKCGQTYCQDHASKFDPLYCEHCVFSVSIVEENFQRVDEHDDYNEETDEIVHIVTKSPVARRTEINGVDWVFLNNNIRNKTEDELKIQLKFYKAAISAMEMELTQKVVKRISGLRDVNGNVLSKKTTTTKTRKESKPAKPVDLKALAEMLKKGGITPEMIAALSKK